LRRELARHDLVWLDAPGWSVVMAQAAPAMVADVARWREMGWPVVVCRHGADAPGGTLTVGLPLPKTEDGAKRRLGCTLARTAIIDWHRPLSLLEVLSVARPQWREALMALAVYVSNRDGAALIECQHGTGTCGASPPAVQFSTAHAAGGLAPQGACPMLALFSCFGSLAMQALTGITYLTPTSDIDLLLHPRTVDDLDSGLALLQHHAATLPLDGEIVFPDGAAVSWKEWAAGGDARVLVKHIDGVWLSRKAPLLAQLQAP
jgi:phosphoribosyl-dephospho-CoA transferase